MKSVNRLLVVVLLIALALPLIPAAAQDGGEGEELTATVVAVYFQTASAGSFADNGDGTYILTLQGIDPQVVWLVSNPALAIQQQNNANLARQWAAAEGLIANAVLQVGDLNIQLTLTSPAYDETAMTETYAATVVEIVAPEGVKEPELPTSFEAANLSISWSVDFQSGLVLGIDAMYQGMRATPEECTAAKQQFNDWKAWDAQQYTLQQQAAAACAAGDAAACQTKKEIMISRGAANRAILPVLQMINTQCGGM
jgi:hypothetical protein